MASSIPAREVEKESASDHPNWLELPRDLTTNILQRLSTIEIVTSACQVCPYWWNICKDPVMWRTIHMAKLRGLRYDSGDNLIKICCYAVARSCGQLEEIDIEYFGTDDLLAYIADCARHLQRIRLVDCKGLSDRGFSEALKKLSQLEELDISSNRQLSSDSLEVVGRCCPLLKSLEFSLYAYDNKEQDLYLFAIAKTMPGLRHLKISVETPANNGILAILNGCPLLQSFIMSGCACFYFCEILEKRCREQIKDFELPIQDCYSSDSDWDLLSENSNWSGNEDYCLYI